MTSPAQPPFQLIAFDTRRGNQEGTEDYKVLAAFPNRMPIEDQSSLAGLFQGLLFFSSTFGKGTWEVAETDKSIWVLHEAEPHIWLALTAAKAWLPRHTTEDSLRSILIQAHMLTMVLAGTVQSLLDQDDTAVTAQEMLLPVLQHIGRHLGSTTSWWHRELRNPLSPGPAYPQLPLSPQAAMVLQACCNRMLLDTVDGISRPVQELAVLYGPHVLWSSLLPHDMAALYCLLATALLHSGSAGTGAGHASSSSSSGGAAGSSSSGRSILEGASWQLLPSGFLVSRGSMDEAVGADSGAVSAPVVYLAASRRWLRLLPLSEGRLLAVMLLEPARLLSSGLLALLHHALAEPLTQLALQVGEDIRATRSEAGHVPGYRFLSEHPADCSVQASPRDKISAMTHHGRALVAGLRDSLARARQAPPTATWPQASGSLHGPAAANGLAAPGWAQQQAEREEQQGAHGGGAQVAGTWELDVAPREVLVKSSADYWGAAMLDSERELMLVRERRSERTLAEADQAAAALADWLL